MRNTAIGALVIGALVGGCGGVEGDPDASVGGPEGGTLTFDAAMLGHDAGSSPRDGGADGGPIGLDAGGPVDGYPDVPRTHVGHPDWNLLTLVSHNVVQDPVTDFEQILLVVRNDHPSVTFCSVRFRFEVFDASGTSITWRSGTFDGDPRRIFSIDAGCIPPGTLGLGYGNSSWSMALEDVASIQYSFQGSGGTAPDVRPIATIANENRTIVDPYGGGMYWAVDGDLRVVSGSIRNPDVTVFPLDARGLPFDSIGQIDLISLYAPATWPYTTTAVQATFTDYLLAHSYSGTSSAVALDTPEARDAAAQQDAFDSVRQEAQARRRAARALP